jgi:hypothetical protein
MFPPVPNLNRTNNVDCLIHFQSVQKKTHFTQPSKMSLWCIIESYWVTVTDCVAPEFAAGSGGHSPEICG